MRIEHQTTRPVSRGTTAGTVQQSGTPSLSAQASPSKRPAQSTLKASRKTTSKSPNSSPEKNCQKKPLIGGKKTQTPSDGTTNPVTSGGNAERGPKSILPDPLLSVTNQDSCEKNLHPHFELDTELETSVEAVAIALEVSNKTNTSTDTSIATSTEIIHCVSAGCRDSSQDTQVVTSIDFPTQTCTMADNDNEDEKIRNETMNVTGQSTIHTPSNEDSPSVENILPAVSDEGSDAPLEISTMRRGAIEMQENEPHAKTTKKGNEGFGVARFLRWQTSFLVLVGLSIPVIWLSADLVGNGPQFPPPT